MKRRVLIQATAVLCAMGLFGSLAPLAQAADEMPDAMMKRLSDEVLAAIKADKAIQAGDTNRIIALVDSKIMPNVNFQRMTAAAVGPAWRQATPEQQKRLQDEFKILLVRTYSGALAQVDDQVISIKPQRSSPTDTDVVVRTEIRLTSASGASSAARAGLTKTAAALNSSAPANAKRPSERRCRIWFIE